MEMKLLRDMFIAEYKLQCAILGAKEVDLATNGKIISMLIYQACYDIQEKLKVIVATETINLVNGVSEYKLKSSFGEIQYVSIGNTMLSKQTYDWIKEQITTGESPAYYSIASKRSFLGGRENILIYPAPNSSSPLTMTVGYISNIRLFDPNDDKDVYSDECSLLPQKYDTAILAFMVGKLIPTLMQNYDKEISRLLVKRFNGSKMGYKMAMKQ